MAKQKNGEQKVTKSGEPRAPKGPELTWNYGRDAALVSAIANGTHSTADLATQLASDPAFADVPAGAITAPKIRLRIYNLREKQGVAIPTFGRSRGYVVDSASLNALLGATGEQPSAQ